LIVTVAGGETSENGPVGALMLEITSGAAPLTIMLVIVSGMMRPPTRSTSTPPKSIAAPGLSAMVGPVERIVSATVFWLSGDGSVVVTTSVALSMPSIVSLGSADTVMSSCWPVSSVGSVPGTPVSVKLPLAPISVTEVSGAAAWPMFLMQKPWGTGGELHTTSP
jgi:hypothetical protein